MMNEGTMTVYVSPETGKTYEIVAKEETRMVGDWYAGEGLHPETRTKYDIYFDGKWVQFALSEAGIERSVANDEGFTDGVYSSARD